MFFPRDFEGITSILCISVEILPDTSVTIVVKLSLFTLLYRLLKGVLSTFVTTLESNKNCTIFIYYSFLVTFSLSLIRFQLLEIYGVQEVNLLHVLFYIQYLFVAPNLLRYLCPINGIIYINDLFSIDKST